MGAHLTLLTIHNRLFNLRCHRLLCALRHTWLLTSSERWLLTAHQLP